jgi:hypothetical protein
MPVARTVNPLKNEAEVLAVALEVGAASVSDVVAWADAVIATEEHPHWSVCDLATMGASYDPEVVHALREVPGLVDQEWVRDELVRRLAQGLAEHHTRADRIASALYQLALANKLPEGELRSLAWWAWDALDLAEQRTIEETRDQVVAEMIAALSNAASKSQR